MTSHTLRCRVEQLEKAARAKPDGGFRSGRCHIVDVRFNDDGDPLNEEEAAKLAAAEAEADEAGERLIIVARSPEVDLSTYGL